MGIVLLNFAEWIGPLQSLANRWMPGRRARHAGAAGLRYVGIRPSCTSRPGTAASGSTSQPLRPLRVVRRVDAQQPGRHPSRMVISGRMADVCAELDRLVALEAAEFRQPTNWVTVTATPLH
jgi:hypothetical protein